MISDISGEELGEDGQTVRFGLHGVDYELDVSPAEAEEFAAALEPYVGVARRVGGRRRSGARSQGGADRARLTAIRAWARENGMDVASRGRIAQHVVDAYEAAHRGA